MSQMLNGILAGNKKAHITDRKNNMGASRTAYAKLKPNVKATHSIDLLM